jgi:hypothetical protein
VSFIFNLFFIVPENQKQMSEMSSNGNGTLIGIFVGMSSFVVIVGIIVTVIKNKRNNEQGNK